MKSPSYERVVEEVDLYVLGDHLNDTETYIRDELARIGAQIGVDAKLDGQKEWPGEELVKEFIWRTNGHMLYASVVIRHIDNPYEDPRDALQNLLGNHISHDLAHSSALSSIYELYRQILRSCPAVNWQRMIEVLEDIEVAELFPIDPDLTTPESAVAILDALAGRLPGQGFRALRPLHAVLWLTRGPGSRTISAPYIHSTVRDFLRQPCASLGLPIDRGKGIQRLLHGCLDCMSKITPQTDIN